MQKGIKFRAYPNKEQQNLITRMNATSEEAKAYYIGTTFNIGIVSDNLQKCTSIEILDCLHGKI